MRVFFAVVVFCVSLMLFSGSATAATGKSAPGEVMRKFHTPGNCPTGLTVLGDSLWLADRTSDKLYRIDMASGKVVGELDSPGYQVSGLTTDGKYLWVLDEEQRVVFKLNPETGIAEKTVSVSSKYPQGLAFDGKYLWVGDRKKGRLHRISTEDGTTINTLQSPSKDTSGLAFDGKYLWVADRGEDVIYMVLPTDGRVILSFKSPSKYPRGLTFKDGVLWNVDYQTDTIYKLMVRGDKKLITGESKRRTLELTHHIRNSGPGVVVSADIYLAVPKERAAQELLGEPVFTPKPTGFLTDQWGQKVAHFHFEDMAAGQSVSASMKANMILRSTKHIIFPDTVGNLDEIPEDVKKLYLSDGSKFWINDPFMKKTARRVVGREKNCYWIARNLFDHVIKHMHYVLDDVWNVAPTVLKRGSGSCSEYSFVYISLCRAAGLPARYVGSVVVRGDDASTDDVYHRWPEVYLPNHGWVPIDPSSGRGIFKTPSDSAKVIGNRGNRYLITTVGGGGSKFLDWEYNSNAMWQTKGPCKVEGKRCGEWTPMKP